MKKPLLLSLPLLLLPFSTSAADIENGKALHDSQCVSCHTAMTGGEPDTLYTREHRRINDWNALQNQVQRCEQNLGLSWFDDQLDDVSAYLNAAYYKFATDSKERNKQ